MANWLKRLLGSDSRSDRTTLNPTPPPSSALLALRRPCWIPATEAGEPVSGGSKFGGVPLIISGQSRPSCGNCGEPMALLVQLASTELPPAAQHVFGDGTLQLFYCFANDGECEQQAEGWSAFSKASLARILSAGASLVRAPAGGKVPGELAPKRIIGWSQMLDGPDYTDAEEHGAGIERAAWETMEDQFRPRSGDKLGGWPMWVQSPDRPSCPRCGQRMHVVFQLDSEDNLPVMFGDTGCGHISQCPSDPDVLAFAWACC